MTTWADRAISHTQLRTSQQDLHNGFQVAEIELVLYAMEKELGFVFWCLAKHLKNIKNRIKIDKYSLFLSIIEYKKYLRFEELVDI